MIGEGKPIAAEIQILTAWNTWYVEALGSIQDLVSESDEKFTSELTKAQERLESLTNSLLQDLEE